MDKMAWPLAAVTIFVVTAPGIGQRQLNCA
jgi:hypothetical protein